MLYSIYQVFKSYFNIILIVDLGVEQENMQSREKLTHVDSELKQLLDGCLEEHSILGKVIWHMIVNK